MESYQKAIEEIHSMPRFSDKPTLDRIGKILESIGNPQKDLKFIHVAGTNGKGSVCVMLESILRNSGLKTGLFISPYVCRFEERIQINGKPVDEKTFVSAWEKVYKNIKVLQSKGVIVNEFEAVTALGMEIFAREKCEIVVLETGLGGKWDATNVIEDPLCTVITSIGFDHTAVLGNTISEITTEKCGIIKENGITVTAPQRSKALEIIRKKAKDKNNIIFFAQDVELDDIEYSIRKTYFTYKGERFSLNLLGSYQIINVKTVFATLSALNVTKKLGFKITLESVHKGLDEAVHLARFQVYSLHPLIIVDGAHNPDGTAQLAKTLHKLLPDEKPIALCGMMADKKIENSLVNLKGVFSKIYTVTVDNPRTATDEAVSKIFIDMGQDAIMCGNVEEGLKIALKQAEIEGKPLVVCGSLFLCGEVLNKLENNFLKK